MRTGGGWGPGVRLPCTEREGGVGGALRPVHERRGHRRRGEESASQPPSVRLVPPARVSTVLTKVPSQRDRAVETAVFTSHGFAGEKGRLTKEDVGALVAEFSENQEDPLAVDRIMDVDQCSDGRVGFRSASLPAQLTMAGSGCSPLHRTQTGKTWAARNGSPALAGVLQRVM